MKCCKSVWCWMLMISMIAMDYGAEHALDIHDENKFKEYCLAMFLWGIVFIAEVIATK